MILPACAVQAVPSAGSQFRQNERAGSKRRFRFGPIGGLPAEEDAPTRMRAVYSLMTPAGFGRRKIAIARH
jgi:hypothetical protein